MSAVVTKDFSILNAKNFISAAAASANNNLYLTIGDVTPWANDSIPSPANTSPQSFADVWNNMIGGKLLTGYNVALAAPVYNWIGGTVYNVYDDTLDESVLLGGNYGFYVYTSDYNVYKIKSTL